MKQEIDDTIGSRSAILFEDLNALQYTTCVLKEVLRLYPPASAFSRYTNEDVNLCGYEIPKGTWITVRLNFIKEKKLKL